MHRQIVSLLCLLSILFLSTTAHAKIVFGLQYSRIDDVIEGIYIMDDDGSNLTILMEEQGLRAYPKCWSPDGKHILFTQYIKRRVAALFLVNVDGTNVRKLIDDNGGTINGGSFSPDGKAIVYNNTIQIDKKLQHSIYVLNIETGKLKGIADIPAIQCEWSPDGKDIVFAWPQNSPSHTIWIMDADGHNPRRLLPEPIKGEFTTYRSRPHWSPDGKQILFGQEEYKYELILDVENVRRNALFIKAYRYYICDRNGDNIRQLSIPKDWDSVDIDWMDDGKSILLSVYVGIPLNKPLHGGAGFVWPASDIYKYHIPTRKITQLTDLPGAGWSLDWISDDVLPVSPKGKKKVTWGTLKQ